MGRTIVSNIIKLIPGVGTGVGGAISGATASLLTTALGEAYIAVMEMIYKGDMKAEDLYSDEGMKTMSNIFKAELKKDRKK